jgi:hypothetical protein
MPSRSTIASTSRNRRRFLPGKAIRHALLDLLSEVPPNLQRKLAVNPPP